jgi:hypothetical protein
MKRPPVAPTTEGPSIDLEANATPIYPTSSRAAKERWKHPAPTDRTLEGAANDHAPPMPPGFTARPVWELAKREGLLRAGEREFKGGRFFELRLWANEGATPTGKGVTMPVEAVSSLARALMAYAASQDPSGAKKGS